MDDFATAFERVGTPGEDPFDLEGDLLDGQIRVTKVIGEGELSVVYRGLHEGIRAPVAIKCLNLPETLDPKLVEPISEGFREGARLHYRLAQGHLHIAQTLALGTTVAPRTGAQIPYLVREWIEGSSLAEDLAARARTKARPRTVAQAVELLDSAAEAIAHAHAEGVCHHTLSPRNLFIATSPKEVVKVVDFGMARDVGAPATGTGLRLLSSHAAPEQLDRRLGTPCPATDVFAFSLVLFECVTGRPYLALGAHVSEVLRVVESREPLRRRGPGLVRLGRLETVLAQALSPRPSERHLDLRVFWDEVRRAVERPSFAVQSAPKSVRPPPLPVPLTTPFDAAPSAPAVAITVEPERSAEPDTIPAPPMFVADEARRSKPLLGASLRTRFEALAGKATAYFVQSPATVARVGAAFAGVFIVAMVATIGRSARTTVANPTSRAERSPRALVDETAILVLGEASLRVVPKRVGFDRKSVTQHLDETAAHLESCTRKGSPRGPGSIRVIVQANGKILRLQIGPPYAGTSTGHCIASRFVATELPAFEGPPRALNYVFKTIPFEQR